MMLGFTCIKNYVEIFYAREPYDTKKIFPLDQLNPVVFRNKNINNPKYLADQYIFRDRATVEQIKCIDNLIQGEFSTAHIVYDYCLFIDGKYKLINEYKINKTNNGKLTSLRERLYQYLTNYRIVYSIIDKMGFYSIEDDFFTKKRSIRGLIQNFEDKLALRNPYLRFRDRPELRNNKHVFDVYRFDKLVYHFEYSTTYPHWSIKKTHYKNQLTPAKRDLSYEGWEQWEQDIKKLTKD